MHDQYKLIMYFPPLVWDNIRDYLGIWQTPYNKVLKQLCGTFGEAHPYISISNIYHPKGRGAQHREVTHWWWNARLLESSLFEELDWSYTVRICKQRYRYTIPFKNGVYKVLNMADYIVADYITKEKYQYYDFASDKCYTMAI